MIMSKKLLALILAVCLLTPVFVGCGKKLVSVDNGGAYYDKREDIKYISADPCYEAMSVSDREYAKMDKISVFEIEGADPEKWLCNQFGGVFYAESEKLPTLSKMDIRYVDVFEEDLSIGKIHALEDILAIIDVYENGERLYYLNMPLEKNLTVKFADTSIGLYYCISYVELEEDYIVAQKNYGKKFFYDMYGGIFVCADGLLDELIAQYESELNEYLG